MLSLTALSLLLLTQALPLTGEETLELVSEQIELTEQRLIAIDIKKVEKQEHEGIRLDLFTHTESLGLVATRFFSEIDLNDGNAEDDSIPTIFQFVGNYSAKVSAFDELFNFKRTHFNQALRSAISDSRLTSDSDWSRVRVWVYRDLIRTEVDGALHGYSHFHGHGGHQHFDWHPATREGLNKIKLQKDSE